MLLMDEPLSNLDALPRLEMRAELKSVLDEAGTTTVHVTHDQTKAMNLADRMAVLHAGRIVQIGKSADVYRHPAAPGTVLQWRPRPDRITWTDPESGTALLEAA